MTRDYDCNVWQSDASIIPPNTKLPCNINDRSYFYIRIVADFSTYLIEDEEEEDSHGLPTRTLEEAEDIKTFKIPADKLVRESTSWSTISRMLSAMDIPKDAQPDMVHRISHCARTMAKASYNAGSKVLPMIVHIFVEDYIVDDGGGSDDDFDMGETIVGAEGGAG
ncbi:hypothetical protein RHMOL_Rhmol08G0215700 [Rhododendron molle]|uniref:Uncharacterized protein n=1 Tax=Rhododendron molle TaxID=49168 RepID=A0ACC0MQW2_RHOML|nr:hypothetical protein RHMOL_Rhmol08G0215700 [Rhododendron molle]